MTRRQVYFYTPATGTYCISDELNGDKKELELFGSSDTCDKTWPEIMEDLSKVHTLPQFMKTLSKIEHYYHSSISGTYIGTRMIVKRRREALEVKDETYGIILGTSGIFLDKELSVFGGEADV